MNEMKPRSAEQATCSANAELAEADVMKALECHATDYKPPMEGVFHCKTDCPYHQFDFCTKVLAQDALALLREKDAEIKGLVDGWSKDQDRFEQTCTEKDALIEDYRQELGRARVALNDANAEIARLREIIVKGDYSSYTARLVTETWHRNNSEFIRRLEAEIERLSHHCDDCAGCTQWKCDCSNIRAEAIDEFVRRIKAHFDTYSEDEEAHALYVRSLVDQIAKEMKEVEQ